MIPDSNWEAALRIVWRQASLQAVYVTHIETHPEAVFVAFLRCPSVTMASGEFAIQDHLRQAVVLHSGYLTSPSECEGSAGGNVQGVGHDCGM